MMHVCIVTAAILTLCSLSASAQSVSVQVNDTTGVSDSLTRAKSEAERLSHLVNTSKGSVESIHNQNEVLPTQKVYSERYLKSYRDSIEKATGFRIPEKLPPVKELSEEDFVQVVNAKFPTFPTTGTVPTQEELQSSETKLPEAPSSLESLKQQDLSSYQLPTIEQIGLAPLPGNIVKSKYLTKLDSIRKINLKDERLTLKEQQNSAQSKLTIVQKKPTFWQKSYFEGVLGIWSGKDVTLYQASPALGYHFTDYFSIGLGPTLQIQSEAKKLYANGAFRTFTKIEFLQRQLYVQVEDSMNPYSTREKTRLDKHNVFVGGGVLLSMKSPVTLNFSVLYKVNEGKASMSDISPFVFRLGISTIKIDK